jgi:hypothetical protein
MDLKNTWTAWLGGLAVCTGLGCATTHVQTERAPNANFAGYRTFALSQGRVYNEGRPDKRDTLVRDRIDSALRTELSEKGLQATNLNPDLIVTYTAGARTMAEVVPNPEAYTLGAMPAPWLSEYREGTLVIDLIDANTKQLVWRSYARAEDKNFRKPENLEQAVDKALEKFPAPAPAG